MLWTTLVESSSWQTKITISRLVIEACKCVTYTLTGFEHHWSRLSHFLIRKKGVILTQNKWFNNSKTVQLPVASPPPLPCTRWETQLHWNTFVVGKSLRPFSCPTFQFSEVGKCVDVFKYTRYWVVGVLTMSCSTCCHITFCFFNISWN